MTKPKPTDQKLPPGRPSSYTPELAADICTRMAEGMSISKITKIDGMPHMSSIFLWLSDKAKPEFSEMYARAREMRAEHIFEESLDIADDTDDTLKDKDGKVIGANHAKVQRDRLRVDTRKWFLAKLDPRRYGERQQVEHSGGVTLDMIIRESYQHKEEDKKP